MGSLARRRRSVTARANTLGGCFTLGLLACNGDPTQSDSGTGSTSTGVGPADSTTTGGPLTGTATGPSTGMDGGSTSASTTGTASTGVDSSGTGAPVPDMGVGTTGVAETTGGSSSGGEQIDCDALPAGPLEYVIHGPIAATEDFALDPDGNAVGVGAGAIFRTPLNGPSALWIPGISDFIAGFRYTSDGVLVYNNVGQGTLFRVVGRGAPEAVLSGLAYPNGMDVDLNGYVYIAEESAYQVRRVNALTGEFSVLAEDLDEPNGISFSPDYHTLYVGSFGGGTITAIQLDDDMNPTSVDLFYEGIGNGALDGMAVDACGNVYVCEYVAGTVWRIPPDASALEPIAYLGDVGAGWIPNMQFGTGTGGWDRYSLYVIEINGSRVFEVPVGVPDKPRGYP